MTIVNLIKKRIYENIGVDGTFRSFIDVKVANLLRKKGWIEKGHSPHRNLIVFYVESAIYHRLF